MSEQIIPTVTIPLLSNNKDIIRIGIEIVVLGVICYYFHLKHNKTTKHIEDISQKMEERDDEIDQLKVEILELRDMCNSNKDLITSLLKRDVQPPPARKKIIDRIVIPPPPDNHPAPITIKPVTPTPVEVIEEFKNPDVIRSDQLNKTYVSLDDELETEIGDLN
jgi:hypothetical protein